MPDGFDCDGNCVVGCISGELIRESEWKDKDQFHKNCIHVIGAIFDGNVHLGNYVVFHYCPQCGKQIDPERLMDI